MMSFASDVKSELLAIEREYGCCETAEAYGMLLFGHSFNARDISLQTENREIAKLYSRLVFDVTGIEPLLSPSDAGKQGAVVEKAKERSTVLEIFGHTGNEPSLRINHGNIENECCISAFIRGVFLSCGTVTSPQKDYHLEFCVPYRKLCQDFMKFLEELDFKPKLVERKGYQIIYFKESEKIEDLLTCMQAVQSSLALMNIKIYKDFRNKANRITNCETANISKTVAAAGEQLDAIARIKAADCFDSLPDELRELALLREENPEMSLRELGEILTTPISRSGVNHRLKRLIQLAGELPQAE